MIKEGLKHRLGNGYGKFGRNGSIWRWQFLWNKGKSSLQDGYDKGKIAQNADIFERLKSRFIQSVLVQNRYYEKAYFFSLFLCSHVRKDDIHVFDLNIKSGTSYQFDIEFTPAAKEVFSKGSLNYIGELVAWAEVQANNNLTHNISQLVAEANKKYSNPNPNNTSNNKAQIFWENLCKTCFSTEEQKMLQGIQASVDKDKKIFYLSLSERQQECLENQLFEKWYWYFKMHLVDNFGFKLFYQLSQQEPNQNEIQNLLLHKFKV